MIKQPMLAEDCEGRTADLRYPLMASAKLDGIRCVVFDGVAYSRSMKPIPNRFVQAMLNAAPVHGMDGELVVGDPAAKNCMQATTSGVMSRDGEPDFKFYIFDSAHPWAATMPFHERNKAACENAEDCVNRRIRPWWSSLFANEAELLEFEERTLAVGYEGLILRDPDSPYKQGRSTLKQGWMLKLKRFTDGEAEVIGVEELMVNGNAQERDERGYAKRSSSKDGLVPGGRLGALRVRDLKTGVEFSIGSGFDARQRDKLWSYADPAAILIGSIVKYKSFMIGVKDAPRFPVFLGFRDPRDM